MIGGSVVGVSTFATAHNERSWSREIIARLRLIGEIIALGMRRQRDTEKLQALARSMNQQLSHRNERTRRLAFGLIRAERQERVRISELLHEDVMQILALVGMFLDASQMEDGNKRAAAIPRMKELLREALIKLRNLAKELRCDVLRKNGVVEELRWQVYQIQQTTNISVDVCDYAQIKYVPQENQLFICRAVSKLLDNVAMHSHANHAWLEIMHEDSKIKIAVCDNGAGFDPKIIENIPSRSFGLFSIREQAELLGGELEIASSSGHGARVTLRFLIISDCGIKIAYSKKGNDQWINN
jgi:signal transduction histidine kinase